VWQSVDPILGKYLPSGDKGSDSNLVGMGGVFNSLNLGLFTYTHHNPIKLTDPDGRKTTVITIIDPEGADHTAVHIDNRLGKQRLFDPAGTGYQDTSEYGNPRRGTDQSSFIGKSADKNAYIKENKKAFSKAKIIQQIFDTTDKQEQKIANKIDKAGDGQIKGQCTTSCKAVIGGVGPFKKGGIKPWTVTPSGLMKDLKDLKPSKTIILPPTPTEDK